MTITGQEEAILSRKSAKLGYSIRHLVKLLIGKEVMKYLEEEEKEAYKKNANGQIVESRIRQRFQTVDRTSGVLD
jgi:translation initiation factor IF-2